MQTTESDGMKAKWVKLVVVLVVIAGLVVLARQFELDQKLGDFREWVAAQGVLGPMPSDASPESTTRRA